MPWTAAALLRPARLVRLPGPASIAGPGFTPDPGVRVPDESELDVFDRHDLARLRAEVGGCHAANARSASF